MSVVVANRLHDPAEAGDALSSLRRELDPSDELIWVDRAGLDTAALAVAVVAVPAPPTASRAHCYGLGLARARSALVAFTDSSTVAGVGWRAAAQGALEAGASVVGGPVLGDARSSARDGAGFLVDYGPHAVPPYTSATGDVSGNNVAYRRDVLPAAGAPVSKSEVNARLAATGVRTVIVPEMRVTVRRAYSWRDLGPLRARSGAQYARWRSAGWPLGYRLPAAVACAALPAISLCRLWRTVRTDRNLRDWFVRGLPWVVLALTAWSAGEAAGYLRTIGDDGVW